MYRTYKYCWFVVLLQAILLFAPFSASARRAPLREISFTQPDGTRFIGRMTGDQFLHYAVDRDGAILIQEEDGWWCYAAFDSDNRFVSTGVRVGKAGKGAVQFVTEVPQAVKEAARARKALSQPTGRTSFRKKVATRSGLLRETVESESAHLVRGLILLAEFQDTTFRYSHSHFENLLNQEGYSYLGAEGCAKEYFQAQFGDKATFEFQIVGPYKLSKTQAWYGANDAQTRQDKNPHRMIAEVCQLADEDVDFSLYDADNDGVIDNVFVFYAGCNEASGGIENSLWPHSWYVKSGAGLTVTLDGKILDRYACTSELEYRADGKTWLASIGTFCHEFSHTLGLLDFYDTDYNEDSNMCGAGCRLVTALMDGGNDNNFGNTPPHYNAMDRFLINERGVLPGPIFPYPTLLTEGEHRLEPVSEGGTVYYVPADVEDEFFFFECRDNSAGWDRYIGGRGLLVYHVDVSDNLTGKSQYYKKGQPLAAWERWICNEINANVNFQCGYLVPADPSLPLSIPYKNYRTGALARNVSRAFFPEGATTFSAANGFVFRSGQSSDFVLSNIRMDGKAVCFTVGRTELPPFVTEDMMKGISFQDCLIYSWDLGRATDAKCIVKFGAYGSTGLDVQELAPYAPGKYAVVLDGLTPQSTYQIEIYYQDDALNGRSYTNVAATMKKKVGNGTPFISFKGVERNADNSFTARSALPLRLVNALDAESVEWYFDGKPVVVDGSGFFTPGKSGRLKAVLRNKNGGESVIIKTINVR